MTSGTEPSIASQIADFGRNVIALAQSEQKTNAVPPKLVAIKDLPVYNESARLTDYKFVEKEKLPLESEFTTIRYAILDGYDVFASRFQVVDRALTKAKNVAIATDDYVRNEWTVLPKAAAITIGGMAGFVLGLKRYGIRKFVYAAGGLTTMAAFCYPHETVDFSRCVIAHAKRSYADFQKSPETPKKAVDLRISFEEIEKRCKSLGLYLYHLIFDLVCLLSSRPCYRLPVFISIQPHMIHRQPKDDDFDVPRDRTNHDGPIRNMSGVRVHLLFIAGA
uniref:MICOS complex subunit n=2 Tax=Panagrellus redivivus TaxID=6233 RepID=A0A7E4WAU6_PANRE